VVYLAAVPWDYRFQRPQQLARAVHGRGRPILYVEAFARQWLQPRWHQCSTKAGPALLRLRVPGRPDPYRERLRGEAAAALAATLAAGVRRPVAAVVLQLPFWEPLGLRLRERLGAPLVYDRIDLHSGFPDVPPMVEQSEERLLRAADLVTSSSADLLARSREAARRTLLLPNATSLADFPLAPAPPAGEVVIGYVGALGPWVDAPALEAAARAHPHWRFELAGRIESEEIAALDRLPNLHLLGEIPYRDVAGFLARLHAALIPFRDLPLTRAVDPVKLYEALAVGVPVVAAALPGTAGWEEPLVYLYRRPAELPRALEAAVSTDDPESRSLRRRAVEEETWEERARRLLDAISELDTGAGSPA